MFIHKHWLLMITCTSEAACKSTFLPFSLEQPCSVLCDCCLPISGFLACGSLLVVLLLPYLSTVCDASCFINSILLLLLYSKVSINHKINSSIQVNHLCNSAARAQKLPVFQNNILLKGGKKLFLIASFNKRAGLCIALQVLKWLFNCT